LASKRHIKTFRGEDDRWYFTIVADNGEPIAQSEGYEDLRDMFDTLEEYFQSWNWVRTKIGGKP
jgi:hypothetical protein